MNTMQQEFDAVVAHLYKQGRPAKVFGAGLLPSFCVYRSPEGLSCAVGCRIPDDKYVPEMDTPNGGEGTGLANLLVNFRNNLPKEISVYQDLFQRLQTAHDSDYHVDHITGRYLFDRLKSSLADIAEEFDLTFTEPNRE